MPLVKRSSANPETGGGERQQTAPAISALSSPDAETRWHAARTLAGDAEAVPALAATLAQEQVPRVREAVMTALMRIGSEESVRVLLPYVRSQDAGLRVAAIEALQALPQAIAPFVAALFQDRDSDVRLLATELVRNMPAAQATASLCALIEHEPHPNVCAAAVEVLAEVGTPDAIPALKKCADRFAGTPFLPFAVSAAIARITGSEG